MAIEFLSKLSFLFQPASIKVAHGGRGGGKTEGFGQALLILAQTKKLRIACFREFHKSMKESVYQTLTGQIEAMDLSAEFDIQATTIISKRTGSEFLFAGLRHNIESIKSMARIDIAWVEEARNISKTSLEKLEPTIRGQYKRDNLEDGGGPFGLGPEIWFSFNPELESDEVYKRFILQKEKYAPDYIDNPRTGVKQRYAYVAKIGLEDNIFAPDDLLIKSNILKNANEDEWLHVYGGHTKLVLDGAIYAEEIKKVLKEGRRGKVVYDPQRVVHSFWDLGHDDYTSIWFIQQVGVEYNVINYFQDRLKKLPYYINHLQSLEYNYGYHYMPHDGDNETLASRSPVKILRDAYPGKVKIVPRVAKKVHGIRAARVIFELCNFAEEETSEGWQCLANYTYKVNEDGVFSKEPDHNEYSHGADAFQTFALSLKSETQLKKPEPRTVGVGRIVPIRQSGTSWMG